METEHNPLQSIDCPLQFDPIYKETIWGGRALETMLGKTLPHGKKIGESWEISGCGNDQSVACTPGFEGKMLGRLLQDYRRSLVGTNVSSVNDFPLLYKLIDANDKLSVQVHPSDADAHANNWGPFGKTECWYFVSVKPGAQIVAGLKNGTSPSDVAEAVRSNELIRLLDFHPVSAGDMVFIPAGTVHAIFGDMIIYETQQTSDVTFRLYDWGRVDQAGKPRTLHVKESLQVLSTQWHESYKILPLAIDSQRAMRIACRYFAMEEYHCDAACTITLPSRESFSVITVLDGGVEIPGAPTAMISRGRSVLLPAAIRRPIVNTDSQTRFLVSWVPDLETDIVRYLRRLGIKDEAIASLGGNAPTNDIIPYL